METLKITSLQNQKIKDLAKLDSKSDLFLVEGFHLVEMALEAEVVEEIFALEPYKEGIKTTLVTPEIIKKLASTKTPEGIIALCHKKNPLPLKSSRVLVLDGVQDPGNVGTLLRTALSFGFMDVVLGQGSADLYNNKTLMASQGSIFKLNVLSNINLVEALPIYKKDGYFLLSTDLKTETTLATLVKPGKLILVLGNEGQGVSPAVQALADTRIRLEMSNIDSLNVAIAGGILMYSLRN